MELLEEELSTFCVDVLQSLMVAESWISDIAVICGISQKEVNGIYLLLFRKHPVRDRLRVVPLSLSPSCVTRKKIAAAGFHATIFSSRISFASPTTAKAKGGLLLV